VRTTPRVRRPALPRKILRPRRVKSQTLRLDGGYSNYYR